MGCASMSKPAVNPSRPWQEIAAEVLREKEFNRILELVEQLDSALASQTVRKPNKSITALSRIDDRL